MVKHSETAWKIASLYSNVLASETRDLAAHIDAALAAERERCAKLTEGFFYGGSTEYDKGRKAACQDVAIAIRDLGQAPITQP